MGVKRKQHSAEFKARVAMASLSGEKTLTELSAEFGVHPTMISNLETGAGEARERVVCTRQQGGGGRRCAEVKLLAESMLDVATLREALGKNF